MPATFFSRLLLPGILAAFLFGLPARNEEPATGTLPLVPWPVRGTVQRGTMPLTATSRIVVRDGRLAPLARVLSEEVRLVTGLTPPVATNAPRDGDVVLSLGKGFTGENHRITVHTTALVEGTNYAAVALGSATLLQSLRAEKGKVWLPRFEIEDGPRLPYCGAMLDVARKPFSLETLRQCIQVCRFYKIRYLHFHLSDENAWVFPSTAYPKLGSQNFAWAGGARPVPYPLAELKQLVAFADERGVTLVPEIEMPGHSGQLRGTLPEIFGYRDAKGKTVTPGVINLVSEKSFEALDTIVGEVSTVFRSSPYFHIGCDEVSLGGIESLPEVKAYLARHRLTSTHAVFNAFVNRMHGIVKKHGKRMIVWEGAPLDPVPPPRDVIFMPWVGGAGSASGLVKRGYAVINPPWGVNTPYFDPYLVNGARLNRDEPLLLGATSLLWESVEEAAVPFLRHVGALRNEPTWNPKALRGQADFLRRHAVVDPILDRLLSGFTFEAKGLHDPLVYMRPDATFDTEATLSLSTSARSGKVRFTLDGTEPTTRSPEYRQPIALKRTTTIKARWEDDEAKRVLPTWTRTYRRVPSIRHDGIGARVSIHPTRTGYPGPGAKGLADGVLADGDDAGSAGWIGWERGAKPIEVLLDLGKPVRITRVGVHCLRAAGGIFLPARVEVALSTDGKTFEKVATIEEADGARKRGWYEAEVKPVLARHVLVSLTGNGDWTFLDEVVVNAPAPGPALKHAARDRPVTLAHPPNPVYGLPGAGGLTDGYTGRSANFMNPQWLGFEGKNLDATIDLGRQTEIREVGVRFLQVVQAGIFVPGILDVLVSDDGKTFRKVAALERKPDNRPAYLATLSAKVARVKGRFVRVVAHTNGQWIFADEVQVNPEAE